MAAQQKIGEANQKAIGHTEDKDKLQNRVDELEGELKSAEATHVEERNKLKKYYETELDEARQLLTMGHEDRLKTLSQELQEKEHDHVAAIEQIDALKTSLEAALLEAERAKKDGGDADAAKQALEAELQRELTEVRASLAKSEKEKDEILQSQKEEAEEIQESVDGLKKKWEEEFLRQKRHYEERLREGETKQAATETASTEWQKKAAEAEYRTTHLETQLKAEEETAASLHQANDRLRGEFERKFQELEEKMEEQESLLQLKDDLIEEANEHLQQYNQEKHNLKAKIKHLIAQYCDGDDSSYKGEEDMDLDCYFSRLEHELAGGRWEAGSHAHVLQELESQRVPASSDHKALEGQLSKLRDQHAALKEEHARLISVKDQATEIARRFEQNDAQMRQKLVNASAKLGKYKKKLEEKVIQLEDLQTAKAGEVDKEELAKLHKENEELLIKLTRAETELHKMRNTGSAAALPTSERQNEGTAEQLKAKFSELDRKVSDFAGTIATIKTDYLSTLDSLFTARYLEPLAKLQNRVLKMPSAVDQETIEALSNGVAKVLKVFASPAGDRLAVVDRAKLGFACLSLQSLNKQQQ